MISTVDEQAVWSVRMRAAGRDGRHLSGAERLVYEERLKSTVGELYDRGIASGAPPDFLQVTIEKIDAASVVRTSALPVATLLCDSPAESHMAASGILAESGVSETAFNLAWELISRPLAAEPMRGAALFDSESGVRLDGDNARGVRATRMDYAPEDLSGISDAFSLANLAHFRTREALLVATKVLWSGVVGELCWSDDPQYTAGYIATGKRGYIRIPEFKPRGALGGRAFFIDKSADITAIVDRLERQALWVHGPLEVRPSLQLADLLMAIPHK